MYFTSHKVVCLHLSPNISEVTLQIPSFVPLFTILYTLPYLVSVVGGCRNKLGECCWCRCLSQQKGRGSTQIQLSVSSSSSCCGLTGSSSTLWLTWLSVHASTLCHQHIFHWISTMISHQQASVQSWVSGSLRCDEIRHCIFIFSCSKALRSVPEADLCSIRT